jgi:hypothetical protein
MERRSFASLGLDPDPPATPLDNPLHDRSFAGLVRSVAKFVVSCRFMLSTFGRQQLDCIAAKEIMINIFLSFF